MQDEAQFLQVKATSLRVGDVKTLENFIVALLPGIDLAAFNTVVGCCKTFGEFIPAAQYR
ncbi:hypothetical protein FQZ97_1018480 [compost metagenome]